MRSSYKPQALLTLITAAALAPFLNKAFHVDDPLFLWMAQQIAKHPLDPYGFEVNWSSFTQPMSAVMQNPPLCSYYIAAIGSIFGWSETSLHRAFLFWAIISILGTFALAQRFCGLEGRAGVYPPRRASPSQALRPPDKRANAAPFQAALLTLFTPIFLVSATTVMCDVVMLALWIWALELWLAGLDRRQWWRFLLSAALISAAALTKYFGLALLPLIVVYTLGRDRRSAIHLLFLLIPLAVISNYELISEEKYGHALFSAAMMASSSISSATRPSHLSQLLMGLAFGGGCLISVSFFALLGRGKILLAGTIVFVLFAVAFKFLIVSWVYLEGSETLVWLEGGLFATIAVGILVLAATNLAQQKNPEALLLTLWVFGTFAFATWFNWLITARTLLPMVPAVALLTIAQFEQRQKHGWSKFAPLLAAGILSILIAAADYRQANCARAAARLYQQRFDAEPSNVRFLGHWGFQYYMEQWGAKPFDRNRPELVRGSILVGSLSDPDLAQIPRQKVGTVDETVLSACPFVATSRIGSGASFYSSFGGPLPWIIKKIPPERYYAAHIR
jgi:4-amino-4-deoxy-L-arabinose transferase-like glycosyltransferase